MVETILIILGVLLLAMALFVALFGIFGLKHLKSKTYIKQEVELLKEDKKIWFSYIKSNKLYEVWAYITLTDNELILYDEKEENLLLKIPYNQIMGVEDHIPRQWSDKWPKYLISRGQIGGPASRINSLFVIYDENGEKKVENLKFQPHASSYYKEIKIALREKSPNIITMGKVKDK